jgi:alpha-L-rhamnosidase
MLNPDGTVYTTNLRGARATDYYTLKGSGKEVYEPTFTFHGFRYVEVTGYPGTPKRDAITGIVVGSDNPQTGSFACSNPLVQQLQHNIFWGQRGNYLSIPTDCPQRDERLGWMGDAQIFVRTACFNNDVAAFMTKWTQDVVDAQSEEGGFSDVSPRKGDPSDGAPAWGDAGVIVPWTIYWCYGDKSILEHRYPAMRKWISYIDSVNPDHIWIQRSNNNFGDWLNVQDDTPRDVLATAYFAYSTELVEKSAEILGKTDDADYLRKLHSQIVEAFDAHFVDADGKIKGDTQTDYVLALRFGLLPEGQRENAVKRLSDHILIDRKGHLSTGFVGVGYLNPTLTAYGRTDIAYKLLENDTYPSWGYSIRQGATTIWERWDGWTKDKGFQDPGMNSFNHYSLGSVGEWMYRTVAGIDLDQPGYSNIVIHPIPGGDLTWAEGTLESIRGRIQSSWRRDGKKFDLSVAIPANTTATIYVPADSAADVTESGNALDKADAIKVDRTENGYVVLKVGGGVYRFESVSK